MTNIAPSKKSLRDLRYAFNHFHAQPGEQSTAETLRKLYAIWDARPPAPAVALALAVDGTEQPAAVAAEASAAAGSSDAAATRKRKRAVAGTHILCGVCHVGYDVAQPGAHFATQKHCKVLRDANEFCTLQCRFRAPVPRSSTPLPPGTNVFATDAPHHIDTKYGVTVCRGCGGLREKTENPPVKAKRPRGRPLKTHAPGSAGAIVLGAVQAATPPPVAGVVSATPVAGVVAATPVAGAVSATPAAVPALPTVPTKTIVRGREITLTEDFLRAQPRQQHTSSAEADTATRRSSAPPAKRARGRPARPSNDDDDDDDGADVADDDSVVSSVNLSAGDHPEDDDDAASDDDDGGDVNEP